MQKHMEKTHLLGGLLVLTLIFLVNSPRRGKYSAPLFLLFPFDPGINAQFRSVTGINLLFLAIPFDNGNRMSVPSFYGMQIY